MKKLFYILCFISSILYGQQVVELCEGNQNTFIYTSDAGVQGTYVWNIDDNQSNTSPPKIIQTNPLIYTWDEPGDYEITLVFTSLGGCKDSVFYNVSVIDCQETTMWFPDAFTPNQSGGNETWSPKGFNYTDLEYYVFNRWGEEIFKSNSELNPWEGKYKNNDCQQDVYIFIAKWKSINKEPKTYIGHITLIR